MLGPDGAALGWACGWLVAVVTLFISALHLPTDAPRRNALRYFYPALIVVLVAGGGILANVAIILHDRQFDFTREQRFRPDPRAIAVVDNLSRPVNLTYYYHADDPAARRLRDVLALLAKRNHLLRVHTVDPDREPASAASAGIKQYNLAVLEAEGRRIAVPTTEEVKLALGIQRALRESTVTVCFIEGHGEYPFDNDEFHTHIEGLHEHSHNHGAHGVATVITENHGVGRWRRGLEALGFEVKRLLLAVDGEVSANCDVAVSAGPRTRWLPHEVTALARYLHAGGSALLLFDVGFSLDAALRTCLDEYGVNLPNQIVTEPRLHYATDREMVAVTGYPQHPITRRVSMTFFPGVRPLTLRKVGPATSVVPIVRSSAESKVQHLATPYTLPGTSPTLTGADSLAADAAHESPKAQGEQTLAVAIERKLNERESTRLVVVGDADFASNSFFPYLANSELVLSMIRWLVGEESQTPISEPTRVPKRIILTEPQMRKIFLVLVVALPAVPFGIGLLVWRHRR